MLDFEDVLLATAGMIESEPSVAMQVREQLPATSSSTSTRTSRRAAAAARPVARRPRATSASSATRARPSTRSPGATPEYLLGFERRYEDATVVRLERNYRSTPEIVDTANRLMRGRAGALQLERSRASRRMPRVDADDRAPPTPETSADCRRTVEPVLDFADELAEARGVATRIRERIDAGVPPETIAVLMRVNSQSAIARARARRGRRGLAGARRRAVLRPARGARGGARAARGRAHDRGRAAVQVGERRAALARLDACSRPRARARCATRWESLNAIARLVDEAPDGHDVPRSSPTSCRAPGRGAARADGRRPSPSRPCTRPRASSGTRCTSSASPRACCRSPTRRGSTRSTRSAGCSTWASRGHGGGSTLTLGARQAAHIEANGSRRGSSQELGTRTRDAARAGAGAGSRPVVRG